MKGERRRRQKGRRENSGVWGERRRRRKARRKGAMRKEQGRGESKTHSRSHFSPA